MFSISRRAKILLKDACRMTSIPLGNVGLPSMKGPVDVLVHAPNEEYTLRFFRESGCGNANAHVREHQCFGLARFAGISYVGSE